MMVVMQPYYPFTPCLVIPESEQKQEWEKTPHLSCHRIAATMSMAVLPFLIPLAFSSSIPSGSSSGLCYSKAVLDLVV